MIGDLLDLQRNLRAAYPCNCNGCIAEWIGWIYANRERARQRTA